MIELIDLMTACNEVLKKAYPDIPVYGIDTTEGFKKPCFVTEIVPFGLVYESRNFAKNSASFKATYLQAVSDASDQLRKAAEIRKAFGMKLSVKNRKLNVGQVSHDYAGEYNDWLQISVDFEWYENTRQPETEPYMEHLELVQARKEQ